MFHFHHDTLAASVKRRIAAQPLRPDAARVALDLVSADAPDRGEVLFELEHLDGADEHLVRAIGRAAPVGMAQRTAERP